MALVIEVLDKQSKVVERHKFDQRRIRLGRAFDNDLILANKHINPHHAELVCNEQGDWQLVDLVSLNGSYTQDAKKIGEETPIRSGEICVLAQQAIRIFASDHPVQAAQPFNKIEQRLAGFGRATIILPMVMCLFIFELLSIWLKVPDPQQAEWSRALIQSPLILLGIAIWPLLLAAWAKFGQHETRFWAQLGITLVALVFLEIWSHITAVLNFSLDGGSLSVWLLEGGQLIVLAALLIANFYLALQISVMKRLMLGTGLAVLLSLQSLASTWFSDEMMWLEPKFDSSLYPLTLYLNKPKTEEEFEAITEQLFEATNTKRGEPDNF